MALRGSAGSLLAQPFPLDPTEFQANTYTTGNQSGSEVAIGAGLGFVVVWTSEGSFGSDLSSYGIQGRRYDLTGTPLGEQFQINSYTTDAQLAASIGATEQGAFVVAWASHGSFGGDDLGFSVQARRFGVDGLPLDATEFQVNTYTSGYLYSQGDQAIPAIAVDTHGNFLVVWNSEGSLGSDTDRESIQARRFAADGTALDSVEFQVNTFTTGRQIAPRAQFDANGGFVVVWQSAGSFDDDNWGWSVQARRFSESGVPIDPVEFQVNTHTAYNQFVTDLAMHPSGDFVVVWQSDITTEGDVFGVQGRRFAADGSPLDAVEFQVNEYTPLGQFFPTVAMNAAGDFAISWSSVGSFGSDNDGASVQVRRYRANGIPVESVETQANIYTPDTQDLSELVSAPDGDFVLTWSSSGSLGSDNELKSIQVRRYGRPTIEVTSTSGGTGGPACTLRDAVAAASTGSPVGGCAAGNEGGILALPPNASIRLTEIDNGMNGLPLVERPVTVRGFASRVERDPGLACPVGPGFRLFEVTPGGVLELEDVSVANGCLLTASGGGIYALGGMVVLNRASVEGNEVGAGGGGIAIVDGSLIARDSTVRGNIAAAEGGGVSVSGVPGAVLLERTTMSQNLAANGGGLALAGATDALIRNSTVSENNATVSGGGIEVDSTGRELLVEFSTVTANLASDGAGVRVESGEIALHGSLVGNNSVGSDCAAGAGAVEASGSNLDSDGSCAALAGGNVTTFASFDLGALADNGGPTRTRLPLPASPALDAAPACVTRAGELLRLDQRGFPRPTDDDNDGDAECELGAVERGPLFADGFQTGDARYWSSSVP